MKLRQDFHGKNWWTTLQTPMIPLGELTVDGKVVTKETTGRPQPVMMRYPKRRNRFGQWRQISNTILIAGTTGSGKSVEGKLVQFFLALDRPIIDFDWAGEDSHLCYMPNTEPEHLPPFTHAKGLPGVYLYFPTKGARPRKPWERIVRPNITKYDGAQLEALGFSPGAAMYFQNLLRRYGPFKDWEALYDFIENFPINEAASRAILRKIESGKLRLKHTRRYEPMDAINNQSKESIKKVLPGIMEKDVFRLDDAQEFDFQAAFLAGVNMVFSFNDKDVGRVEINHYMLRIKTLRRQFRDSPRYFVKIEEAHKVLAAEGKRVDEAIEEFVLVCRKASVGLLLIMPTVDEKTISDKVLDDIKDIIAFKLAGESAWRIAKRCGVKDMFYVITHLALNRFTDEREAVYFSSDEAAYWTFKPYNSPLEIHREVEG